MPDSPSPSESHGKHSRWIAIVIWLALLIANLVTSIIAVSALTTGGLLNSIVPLLQRFELLARPGNYIFSSTSADLVALISALISFAAIGLILLAWLRFVSLSRALVIAYAWLEKQAEASTLFSDMLIFPLTHMQADERPESDLDNADKTLVSEVIRYLAYAWVVMLLMPPIASLATVLF